MTPAVYNIETRCSVLGWGCYYYYFIINAIYRAQKFAVQLMRQVSCCMETVILEQEHFQSFPEHWQ